MGDFTLGRYSYSYAKRRGSANSIIVGNFTSIAEDVVFDSGFQHDTRLVSTFPFTTRMDGCSHVPSNTISKGDIFIGSDVWIGEGALIMSNVKIGDGAIIAARAVVTKDVQDYTIVGGVPAEFIRYRYDPLQINELLKMKWWDWSDERIKANIDLISGDDVDEFIKKHK